MMPRRCEGCNEMTLGCFMGVNCPKCGWPDTRAGRFWSTRGEQPHFIELSKQLSSDPEKALVELDQLRAGGLSALDATPDVLKPAAESLAGKKIRVVVAVAVIE